MKHTSNFIFLILIFPLLVASTERKVYIVYLGKHSGEKTHEEIEEHHHSYLYSLRYSKEEAKSSILYSYKNNINGFAAILSQDEALKLSELDEVINVFPSEAKILHTTRSWEFIGLRKENNIDNDLLVKSGYGKHIIIGLLDTGIWPEAESFSDEGMSPIPKSWKGICQSGVYFNSSHCNRKIIGARYYSKGYEKIYGPITAKDAYNSSRDNHGHGTHTASTVGGRFVHGELDGGLANGTASGGAPLAHLAIYKVCWPTSGFTLCLEEDILAAFDDAIGDGVDILSISLGGRRKRNYASDSIAIGSLHATKENIVVACSGGNSGPGAFSVTNIAPWIITIAASSIDRAFLAPLSLGNGMNISGETLTTYKLKEKMYPLINAKDQREDPAAGSCRPGYLSPRKTKGKIVLCPDNWGSNLRAGKVVKKAGGVGFVYGYDGETEELYIEADILPATSMTYTSANKVIEYINSTKYPTAYINPVRTVLNVKPAPKMAVFSSRGPNIITPSILKPNITCPGIDILAAWTEASLSKSPQKFKLDSGTSMACPHVAAIAALIKVVHPTWSSAAIKSAIMTTAVQTDNTKKPITGYDGNKADPFQFGSGHINPSNAADPGLVYDASYTDYLLFLCNEDPSALDKSFKCPPNPPTSNNLNYPSLSISKLNGTVTVERVVTNVGDRGTTYISQVEAPQGVSVKVFPSRLHFHSVGEKKRFTITIKAEKIKTNKNVVNDGYVFGWYSWTDGSHVVNSPMAINLA